jgi:outer membrane protein assembly factor BamB
LRGWPVGHHWCQWSTVRGQDCGQRSIRGLTRRALLSDDVALLFGCGGGDLAFDLVTGAQLWTWPRWEFGYGAAAPTMFYREQYSFTGGSPLYSGTTLTSGSTTVEAVDARTGTPRWSVRFDRRADRMAAFAGQLYITQTLELTAYDGATGEARWTWDSPRGWGMDRLAGSSDQLVVAGGSYRPDATTGGTSVVSVDPDSGSTRWQITLPEAQSNNLSAALLTVAGDTAFAAAGPTVYAIAAG